MITVHKLFPVVFLRKIIGGLVPSVAVLILSGVLIGNLGSFIIVLVFSSMAHRG